VTQDQAVLLALAGLALLCLVLLVAVLRLRAAGARSRADLSALQERVTRLGSRPVAEPRTEEDRTEEPGTEAPRTEEPAAGPAEFVITDLGTRVEPEPEPVHLDGATFADIVLKETVVKAASLAHGVRRGLAPETRNRIRFQMRQEVRRARRQRRADLKAAQRDLHARQRAALVEDRADAEEAS
jgi:hypothetical protein